MVEKVFQFALAALLVTLSLCGCGDKVSMSKLPADANAAIVADLQGGSGGPNIQTSSQNNSGQSGNQSSGPVQFSFVQLAGSSVPSSPPSGAVLIRITGNFAAVDGNCSPGSGQNPPSGNSPSLLQVAGNGSHSQADSSSVIPSPISMAKYPLLVAVGASTAISVLQGQITFPAASNGSSIALPECNSGSSSSASGCPYYVAGPDNLPAPDANGNLTFYFCNSSDGATCDASSTFLMDAQGNGLASLVIGPGGNNSSSGSKRNSLAGFSFAVPGQWTALAGAEAVIDRGCGHRSYY
jgi:hypothetical protein